MNKLVWFTWNEAEPYGISGIIWLPFPAITHTHTHILYDYILYCIFQNSICVRILFFHSVSTHEMNAFLCFRIFCYSLHWFDQSEREEEEYGKITESQIHNHFKMNIKKIIIILMTWEWFEWIDCLALQACSVKKYWSLNEVINSSWWEIDRNSKNDACEQSQNGILTSAQQQRQQWSQTAIDVNRRVFLMALKWT